MTKIALIIGGSGDIGIAITKLLAQNGFKTYATYYKNQESAKKLSSESNCIALQLDARNESSAQKVVSKIIGDEGKLDLLVDCLAPSLKLKPFETLSHEEIREDVETMLLGSAFVLKEVVPIMKKNKSGTIINISSQVVRHPPARMSSYVSAKAGLEGLLKALEVELTNFNVRIVTIAPSFVETKLLAPFPAKLLEIEREKDQEKKLITPQDIAELVKISALNPTKFPSGTEMAISKRAEIKKWID